MDSYILVLNSGSSSLKYSVYTKELKLVFKGHVDGIGLSSCKHKYEYKAKKVEEAVHVKDHLHAVMKAMSRTKNIIGDINKISRIGHRVVHGGEKFSKPIRINKGVIEKIKSLTPLAPLHNPPALAGILACKNILPKTPQYAVFDTAFHHSIPKEAFLYGLPIELYEQHGVRKYGFHGISHEYVAGKAREHLSQKDSHEIITCHLGNGSSITAIKDGKSIDTSMGFTPLEGLIMGTRSGGLDPEIILYLLQKGLYTTVELERVLQKESGLKGIGGSSDVRELHRRALGKDKSAQLALDMLSYRIAQYIGSYSAALKGLDAIVFTGGIGENAYYVRKKACSYLHFLGLELDSHLNRKNSLVITTAKSKVKVFVIESDEAYAIAQKIAVM